MCFSPDGRRLAAAFDRAVRLWDVRPGPVPLAAELEGFRARATAVGFSPDGRRVVARSGEAVKAWDTITGKADPDNADYRKRLEHARSEQQGKTAP